MKLLLDENLSDRIVPQILNLYPDSSHVKSHGLIRTDDLLIWSFARKHGYTNHRLQRLRFSSAQPGFGHPPKVVYLRVGNSPTSRITQLLRSNFVLLAAFDADQGTSILVLP